MVELTRLVRWIINQEYLLNLAKLTGITAWLIGTRLYMVELTRLC
jgi:hypothetical protein